jgi:hypothetical protein
MTNTDVLWLHDKLVTYEAAYHRHFQQNQITDTQTRTYIVIVGRSSQQLFNIVS